MPRDQSLRVILTFTQTVFERSFTRTLGLARLLVLEKLPKPSDRDAYIDKRRRERGRPVPMRISKQLRGNIKNDWDDEVPEWVDEEDVSDYHTFVSNALFDGKPKTNHIRPFLMAKDSTLERLRNCSTLRICCSMRNGTNPKTARSTCIGIRLSSATLKM